MVFFSCQKKVTFSQNEFLGFVRKLCSVEGEIIRFLHVVFPLSQLEEQLNEKDEEKSSLNEMIEEFKKQLSKAEDDTDRVR